MSGSAYHQGESVAAGASIDFCRLAPGLRQSCLDPALVGAYCSTSYLTDDTSPLVLRVGQRSDRLASMMASTGAQHALFITAWNPNGLALASAVNALRAEALCAAVEERGLAYWNGRGVGDDDLWPPEPSLLVLGGDEALSVELGDYFEQNAVVVSDGSGEPWLLLLR